MSYSYTTTESFTVTNARRLAAKVASDMHQSLRLYGKPSLSKIEEYQEELTVMLIGGYLESYEFGFKTSDGKRIVSWMYTVSSSGELEGGRSGGLYSYADVSSARSFNYVTFSNAWFALSQDEKDKVNSTHPVDRTTGDPPQDGNGYWSSSREYSSGGVAITRKEFRPYDN
jgi:hypothetical protein